MSAEILFDQIAFCAGLPALLGILLIWRLRWRWLKLLLVPVVLLTGIVAGVAFWYTHRPLPANEQRMLFDGIAYTRDVRVQDGEPLIVHVIRIDLDTPGLSFFVTPHTPTDGHDQKGRTTSQFLDEFDLSLAINADAFAPWHEYGPFNYYPHVGDPVDLRGFTASNGDAYTEGYDAGIPPTIYISADNRVTFNERPVEPYNAVSGLHTQMIDGAVVPLSVGEYQSQRHPRTAIALDRSGRILLLILIDGRQPNYSEGASLDELRNIAVEYGAWSVINLDGGGSTTLVMANDAGQAMLLNSPIHTRIPGTERPIGNHLGILAGQTSPN